MNTPGSEHPRLSIEPVAWKAAMGSFPSGVTVVTSQLDGDVCGTTVSAFSSVSLEPPLALVCLDRSSRTLAVLLKSRVFAINILAEGQDAVAMLFARRLATDRFGALPWRQSAAGVPLIEGCAASVECRVSQVIESGDHKIVVGEGLVVEVDPQKSPLVYCRGQTGGLS